MYNFNDDEDQNPGSEEEETTEPVEGLGNPDTDAEENEDDNE